MFCGRSTGRQPRGHDGARLSGTAYIVAAAVLWGLLGPLARVVLDAGVDPVTIGAARALIAGCIYSVQMRVVRTTPIAREDWKSVIALGIGGVAVFYAAYLMSVREGGPALAAILLYTAPVWVAFGARVWLAERITGRMWGAIGMTITGVACVALGGSSRVTLGAVALLWGLLSGATYALYYLLGRPLFGKYSTERVLSAAMLIGAVALLPFSSPQTLVGLPALPILSLVAMAISSTWLAYLIYAAGLRRVPASRAATIATVEPVVAMTVAYLAWGEALRPLALVGAAIVIAGVVVASRKE